MKNSQLLVFFIFIMVAEGSLAQNKYSDTTLHYSILKSGDTIGIIEAKRFYADDTLIYDIRTEVITKALVEVHLTYMLRSEFVDKKMVYALLNNYANGKQKTYVEIHHDEGKYLRSEDKNAEEPAILPFTSIGSSIAELYFKEPIKKDSIFSEKFGNYLPISKQEDGSYFLDLPDGKNYYFYNERGLCQRAEIKNLLATLTFILVEN